MAIARKHQLYLVVFALNAFFVALFACLLVTGALGAGLRELGREFILASVYKFC